MSDIAERALHTRTGRSIEALRRAFKDNLYYITAKPLFRATPFEHYIALAYTVRDRLLDRFIASTENYKEQGARRVAYLSAEFLIGPQLGNNLLNLGLMDNVRQALEGLGLDLDTILETEPEPGLGNGGLGRLAACYMDSLASLEIPAIGYGIRYEYGLFDQVIRDGWQVEVADAWLKNGNPWEIPNRQLRYAVPMGGQTETRVDEYGRPKTHWQADCIIYGQAYDTPILGYGVNNVNRLRLWKAEAREAFDFHAFNVGDYYGAVNDMVVAENITKVLYPNDEPAAGKALRLKQQYFFVSCSLQDMLRITLRDTGDVRRFPEQFVAQLNDTHPAIAVAELMRLLLDEHDLPWDAAWDITRKSFAYTNHTLLPEALETWPVALFQKLLPRHLEIIYQINSRFLDEVRVHFIDEPARIPRMSLIEEEGERKVRMAHLACVGSFAINGVAALHTELLKSTVLADFHALWPEKFSNKTNGVTPRRFIALANPPLAALLDEAVGPGWVRDLERLRGLEPLAEDAAFQERWRGVKRGAKEVLTAHIHAVTGVAVDPDSLFDVQVKRIHEYKRQHLNVLHIIALYLRLKHQPGLDLTPRTFIFGGKAAPGYRMAKLILKLIHAVAEVINHDPEVRERIKVVFVPDLNVKNGQRIYPAADLSEQISTAGFEASGTGNMKFSMNGALTLGTLDGANVEIRAAVGAENFFLFGHSAEDVARMRQDGYQPWRFIEPDNDLRGALALIQSGLFSHGDHELFSPFTHDVFSRDPYLVCADFQSYLGAQAQAGQRYRERQAWTRMSVLNVARIGPFSSDRAVAEYNRDIWRARLTPVALPRGNPTE